MLVKFLDIVDLLLSLADLLLVTSGALLVLLLVASQAQNCIIVLLLAQLFHLLDRVEKLFVDHHSLVVVRHAPFNLENLVLRPEVVQLSLNLLIWLL